VRKRPLGKTGLSVSELALGTWGLSGDAVGPIDDATAENVVARAIEIGVTTFDTSDAYGGGKMEALLGRLAPKTGETVIVTKLGTDRTLTPPQRHFDLDYLERAATASLKRLGRDRIDVLLLHNPTTDALLEGVATGAAAALKEKGLAGHWGVSVGDVETARLAIANGAEVIELAYNLFHPSDLHRLAGDIMVAQVGVLGRSPLGYGILAGLWAKDRVFPAGDHRRGRWTAPELARRIEHLEAIRFLVRGDVRTPRAAAVRFVLANHLVSAVLLGPRSVEQLEQLIRETGSGPTYLSDPDLAALPRALSRVGIAT